MGLLNEIIGAVVAVEAVDKIDPEAGFFKKGLAAIAGFEGEKMIEEKITSTPLRKTAPPRQHNIWDMPIPVRAILLPGISTTYRSF